MTALRLCGAVQRRMGAVVDADGALGDWMDLVEPLVELPAARACGWPEHEVRRAVVFARAAPHRWPGDAFFRRVPFYVRHNRARDGPLREGDPAPNPSLHRLLADGTAGDPCPLYLDAAPHDPDHDHDHGHADGAEARDLVLIAGSVT